MSRGRVGAVVGADSVIFAQKGRLGTVIFLGHELVRLGGIGAPALFLFEHSVGFLDDVRQLRRGSR